MLAVVAVVGSGGQWWCSGVPGGSGAWRFAPQYPAAARLRPAHWSTEQRQARYICSGCVTCSRCDATSVGSKRLNTCLLAQYTACSPRPHFLNRQQLRSHQLQRVPCHPFGSEWDDPLPAAWPAQEAHTRWMLLPEPCVSARYLEHADVLQRVEREPQRQPNMAVSETYTDL